MWCHDFFLYIYCSCTNNIDGMVGCITRSLKVSFHRSRSHKSVFVITTNRTTVYFLFIYKRPRLSSSETYINLLSLSLSISNSSYEDRYLEVVLMLSEHQWILVVGWFSVLLLTLCCLMPNTGIVILLFFFLFACLYCLQNLLFSFLSFYYRSIFILLFSISCL